jgi:UDP-N-acetylmuramoyl-tripeptide--D-alanyl-D-alanine ligase
MLISNEILERAGIKCHGHWDEFIGYSTIDARKVEDDGIFWALTTGQNDGHNYVEQAFENGAAVVAVNKYWAEKNISDSPGRTYFVMDDTLIGMQKLATEVRRSLGAITIGITGSNGKTTTRLMVAAALSTVGKTSQSFGNFNNHIGVPLTILNADGDEQFLVVEIGANHSGDIADLCGIAFPEIGMITNIGDAHIGEFGSYEALAEAKGELFDNLAENGQAVVNLDDDNIVLQAEDVKDKTGYTLKDIPDEWRGIIYAGKIKSQDSWSRTTIEVDGLEMKLSLPGLHWTSAALGAYAVANELGADPVDAVEAIGKITAVSGRGEIIDLGDGVELLDESYNANVSAIEACLTTLSKRPGKKIAILGDVFELGEFEEEEHGRIGRIPELNEIDEVYFVGPRMGYAADEAECLGHPGVFRVSDDEFNTLAQDICDSAIKGAGIVVKGSRLIGLDKIVSAICEIRKVKRD